MKLNYLINLLKKSEINNLNNIIFLPCLSKIINIINEDDELKKKNENNLFLKIKKTKRMIEKLTKDYLKQDEKIINYNKFERHKDKIFYILLNNMYFINNNQNKKKTYEKRF